LATLVAAPARGIRDSAGVKFGLAARMEYRSGAVVKAVTAKPLKYCPGKSAAPTPLKTNFHNTKSVLRRLASFALPISVAVVPALQAQGIHAVEASPQLIVIGFMGGRVSGNNLLHNEALLAKQLRDDYPGRVYATSFANRDAHKALKIVLHLLDTNRDGSLSADEKRDARIVIYGHSWGASEAVSFARRLNALNIPVLLTIQVDSIQKTNENDEDIPPNVREAINFYQTEGLLHGRTRIEAMDPGQTTILGNYKSSYRTTRVSCANYPWFARTFMRAHIEIENDPLVWSRIAAIIRTKLP
jgi:hypothetical protein